MPIENKPSQDQSEARAAPAAMTHNQLGVEIKQLRKARKMTLKQLSKSAGVSVSYISAIERGAGKPSVDTIEALASALDVDVHWFFPVRRGAGPLERAYIVRAEDRRNLNRVYNQSVDEIGYADSLLSSSIGGKFYMGLSRYAPGADRPDEPFHQHEGEQHGVVIQGELEMLLGGEIITLRAGDSYSFEASIPHHGRNRSDQETILVWAVSPVVIPKDVLRDDSGSDNQ